MAKTKIGRNDPCPCGSGKKYKKCHALIEQLEREAERETQPVESVVSGETLPWQMYQIIEEANAQHLTGFFYKMFHSEGPLAARHSDAQEFLQLVDRGEVSIPGGRGSDLLRYREDAPDVHLLIARNHDNPAADSVDFQIVTLRLNEFGADLQPRSVPHFGWRIWDIIEKTVSKDELTPEGDAHLDELGITWHPREYVRGSFTLDRHVDASSEEE